MEAMFIALIRGVNKMFTACMDGVTEAIEQKFTLRLGILDREVHDVNVPMDTAEIRVSMNCHTETRISQLNYRQRSCQGLF